MENYAEDVSMPSPVRGMGSRSGNVRAGDSPATALVIDAESMLSDVTDAGLAESAGSLLDLAGALRAASSGVAFIYHALEVIAARHGVRDAVLVLDDAPFGRQAFRLPPRTTPVSMASDETKRWLRAALQGRPGLLTVPPVVDGVTSQYLVDLAVTALRMDLLDHDASHDPLTGLLNRRSYDAALSEAVARARRYDWPFALILLDLDNFKAINDRLGHAAGDEALRIVGSEIRAVLRSGDVAARLGGDEFALLVLNADSVEVLEPLAERLRVALEQSPATAGIRFSAGVATYPRDADEGPGLQRIADTRLYADKASAA